MYILYTDNIYKAPQPITPHCGIHTFLVVLQERTDDKLYMYLLTLPGLCPIIGYIFILC